MIYFTVGPSQIHEAAQSFIKQRGIIDILSLSHRSSDFSHLYHEVTRKLRALLGIPESHHIFFLSSANEAWERVIQNTVAKKSAHYTTGAFGVRFAQIATELGRDTYVHTTASYQPIDFASLECPPDAEVACFTHNESSTGLVIPLPHLYEFKKRHPHALLALDVVSSFPYAGVDFESIDMAYVSVQKGFGLPAGMCILIVSPRAYAKSHSLQKSGHSIGSYHSFPALESFAVKGQTPETPNVFVFSLLDAVLDAMRTRSLDAWQADLEARTRDLYAWFEKKSGYR
jgi:phosphoserine aminotransferase